MKRWQELLGGCARSADELRDRLHLDAGEVAEMDRIAASYPICIPEYYLDLIDPADPHDPIRKMCVPDVMEFSRGGSMDTSGEHDNTVVQGMQHKYRQTVMILSTNQCAMYCRHCFRKRLVGLSSEEVAARLPEMAAYVRDHPEIDNVLISGGDAFLNTDDVITGYLETFASIPHIRFIRFGTRTPVTFPFRITADDGELTDLLARYGERVQIIVVTHFNHPREVTDQSIRAIRELQRAGCVLRNQTVLLRGVNDDPAVLSALLNRLVSVGVMPYYVFQCRPVEGVKNQFQVPLVRGARIVDEAKAEMSGIAKAFRYAMSHPDGKFEILGSAGEGKLLFKFHQAKDRADNGRLFVCDVADDQCWLDDEPSRAGTL